MHSARMSNFDNSNHLQKVYISLHKGSTKRDDTETSHVRVLGAVVMSLSGCGYLPCGPVRNLRHCPAVE